MTLAEWLKFHHDEQHDDVDVLHLTEVFNAVAGSSGGLTQLQFQWLLLAPENSAIDPARLAVEEPEHAYFSQPVGHYWVSCSHNTFLDGDQLGSGVTQTVGERSGRRLVDDPLNL